MRTLQIAVALAVVEFAAMTIADAAPQNSHRFRDFSRARLISIGDKICGPNGNKPLCCRINDGIWRSFPAPGHCLYM